MSDNDLDLQIEQNRTFGQSVCEKISQYISKLGFDNAHQINAPVYETAVFNLQTDPYTQMQNLMGYWYNASLQRIGQIKFNSDGSVYAEYDIVLPHPSKKQWFVEAINAWGQPDNIKVDAKLLDLPQ